VVGLVSFIAMAKRRKKVSTWLPITRSLAKMRADGWLADYAERKMGVISSDWCGFADLVGIRHGPRVLLVQATSWGHVADRVRKILRSEAASRAALMGASIVVWGWDPYKDEPRTTNITLSSPWELNA